MTYSNELGLGHLLLHLSIPMFDVFGVWVCVEDPTMTKDMTKL